MAVDTYSGLVTYITNKFDNGPATVEIDNFIQLAESYLNRNLRVRQMEAEDTITLTNAVGTLPSDYLAARTIDTDNYSAYPLKVKAPRWLRRRYTPNRAGVPQYCAIEGNQIEIFPATATTVELQYYQKIPALTSSNQTNWLIDEYPDLYLDATMYEAEKWREKIQAAAGYRATADQTIRELNAADQLARYSNVRVSIDGPTP